MAKISLADLLGGSIAKINDNFNLIKNVLNNKVLWRDNPTGEPNQMLTNLDMNSKRILNLPYPETDLEPLRKMDVVGAIEISEAVDAAMAAQASASAAQVSAAASVISANNAITVANSASSAIASTNAALASAVGSTLVGYANGGTAITTQAALDLLYYGVINVRNPKYAGGAKGDGVTDDTNAIKAAAIAAGYAGNIYFPGVGNQRYLVTSTITLRGATKLLGDGVENTIVYRVGDYGDTFVCGTSADQSEPARSFGANGIRFQHSDSYIPNSTTINNKVTQGAHIRLRGAQEACIKDCWFYRMRYGVYSEGGSWVKIINCQFSGVYDKFTPALQESVAQLVAAYSPIHGNPTTWVVTGNNFLGATFMRNVTYTATSGSVVVNRIDTVGSQFGFLIDGLEDLDCTGNYFGGQSEAEMAMINTAGGGIIDIRIKNNFFDGIAQGSGILFAPTVSNALALAVTIEGNTFTDNLHAIFANVNSTSNTPSVHDLTIRGNICLSGIGSQILLNGAKGFVVSDNNVTDYNKHNISINDVSYQTGIVAYGVASGGVITDNNVGGGGNGLVNNTASNFCYGGVSVDATLDGVTAHSNNYIGIRTGSNFRTGLAKDENQATVTTGSYQVKSSDSVVIINKSTAGNTAVALPLYPVFGREVVIKDGKGDAATNISTVTTNDSTLIDGAATSSLATNYISRRYRFNGTQWNII